MNSYMYDSWIFTMAIITDMLTSMDIYPRLDMTTHLHVGLDMTTHLHVGLDMTTHLGLDKLISIWITRSNIMLIISKIRLRPYCSGL